MRILDAQPACGGFVTSFANCHASVCRCRGLGRQPEDSRRMTSRTASDHSDIAVVFGRDPAGVAALVAGRAVGSSGDMVAVLAGRGRAVVAG